MSLLQVKPSSGSLWDCSSDMWPDSSSFCRVATIDFPIFFSPSIMPSRECLTHWLGRCVFVTCVAVWLQIIPHPCQSPDALPLGPSIKPPQRLNGTIKHANSSRSVAACQQEPPPRSGDSPHIAVLRGPRSNTKGQKLGGGVAFLLVP